MATRLLSHLIKADPQGVAPTSQTASRRPNRLTWPGIGPPALVCESCT